MKTYPEVSTLAPNVSLEYTPETGEVQIQKLEGNSVETYSYYTLAKAVASAFGTPNLKSIGWEQDKGRGVTLLRYAQTKNSIEELYGVDVIQDVRVAKYFSTLTDKQIALVAHVAQNPADPIQEPTKWDTTITAFSSLQKVLYAHLTHGAESYKSKQFFFRTNTFLSLATNKNLSADMSKLETVVPLPTMSAEMTRYMSTLPTGEWLQGPIEVEHLGKGMWRVGNELEWAKKWSVIYGGTLFKP